MWKEENFTEYLLSYCENESINRIFLIDNNYKDRPNSEILNHNKIKLISYRKNIYVNPAWNEGYYRSTSDVLCVLNDDIFVDASIFQYMSTLDFSNIDIIGVHLKGSIDNYHIVNHPDKKEELIKLNLDKRKPIGGQAYAFGVCMFIKRSSYRPIPSLYKIWYGDDYLVQRCDNVYALKTSKITGEISKTIVNFENNSSIKNRIKLDSRNAYSFNHFMNVKNWDLVRQYATSSK
jgi:hypothetical protein